MDVRDYICRNYITLASLAKDVVARERLFLIGGDQLLNQAIALMERDYRDEAPEVAFNKAMGRLSSFYHKIEKEV